MTPDPGDWKVEEAPSKNVALVVLNDTYTDDKYPTLQGVIEDGDMLEKMLEGYEKTVVKNEDDIFKAIRDFKEKHQDLNVERMHFHFSGHGSRNAKISAKKEKDNFNSITPDGTCIIGAKGRPTSIHDLKHKLLELRAEKIVMILDCCRSVSRQARDGGEETEEIEVKLWNREAIPIEDQEKIAVLYGSVDGHTISDDRSFTKELYRVTKNGSNSIPILELANKVNESWEKWKIRQRCIENIVKVGDNWSHFNWPKAEKKQRQSSESSQESLNSNTEDGEKKWKKKMDEMIKIEREERESKIKKLKLLILVMILIMLICLICLSKNDFSNDFINVDLIDFLFKQ